MTNKWKVISVVSWVALALMIYFWHTKKGELPSDYLELKEKFEIEQAEREKLQKQNEDSIAVLQDMRARLMEKRDSIAILKSKENENLIKEVSFIYSADLDSLIVYSAEQQRPNNY